MSNEYFLLDTSAILTLIEDEPGAERVQEILATSRALLTWSVLLETHYISRQEAGEAEADRRYALLKQLPAQILWAIDEPTVLTAARLKATQHVSFADAIVAAYAVQHDAILVHKDPEYIALATEIKLEALPLKGGIAAGKT